jgi:glycerol-3-phosphate cytidylyltransferase
LIAGVVADDVLMEQEASHPVIPLAERLEIVRHVRFVDAAHAAMTNNKVEIWNDRRFNIPLKSDDWQGPKKGNKLERDFSALGVEIVFLSYTQSTSSSVPRKALRNIDAVATRRSSLEFFI